MGKTPSLSINYRLHFFNSPPRESSLMPVSFPRPPIAVVRAPLVFFAAAFAHKNPDLSFTDLDAEHGVVIRFAGGAGFCLHRNSSTTSARFRLATGTSSPFVSRR